MYQVIHGNNQAMLLADLITELQSSSPSDIFATQTILTASPDMAKWITWHVAERFGIAAQLKFPFPSTFFWQLLRQFEPDLPKNSPFDKGPLTFSLLELFNQPALPEALKKSLMEKNDAQKYQLAAALADVYDGYQMYRPDWLTAWQKRQEHFTANHWQAHLWHALCEKIGSPARSTMIERLFNHFQRLPTTGVHLPDTLYVFGVSNLPPRFTALLKALGEKIDVRVYVQNPSPDYWFLESTKKEKLANTNTLIPNPLMATLARQGRDFLADIFSEEANETDYYQPPKTLTLLNQVQYSLFQLDSSINNPIKDTSIQVHSCHNPVREIEILKNQLLELLSNQNNLRPDDIVVMTPNIEAYTTAIHQVFGNEASPHLPYSLTDRNTKAENLDVTTFLSLLQLPQSRFSLTDIFDLLEQSPLRNKFKFNDDDIDIIKTWVISANVRWGADENHRVQQGALNTPETTWRQALNRLLLGYACDGELVFEGISALPLAQGNQGELLGLFSHFFNTLHQWKKRLNQAQTPTSWQQILQQLLNDFFEFPADSQTPKIISDALSKLVENASLAQWDDELSLAHIQTHLETELSNQRSKNRFMGAGITFCEMVPMRSIPFKVVCLLGMNHDAFPRPTLNHSLNLMQRFPRAGDRNPREDDRYLFLEALLSARDVLYLSYLGHDDVKGETLAPSSTIESLKEFIGEDAYNHILYKHPLHRFDLKYFENTETKLFSFDAHALALCLSQQHAKTPPAPLLATTLEPFVPESISISALTQFFKNPIASLLRTRFNLRFDHDTSMPVEPYDQDYLEGLHQYLIKQTILENNDLTLEHLRSQSRLPVGQAGTQWFHQLQNQISTLNALERPALHSISLMVGKLHLQGQIPMHAGEGLFIETAKLNGSRLMSAWISHVILNKSKPTTSKLIGEDGEIHFSAVPDAPQLLDAFIEAYLTGMREPAIYLPNSAYAISKGRNMTHKDYQTEVNRQKAPMFFYRSEDIPNLDEMQEALCALMFNPMLKHIGNS